MRRRSVLRAGSIASLGGIAGCTGGLLGFGEQDLRITDVSAEGSAGIVSVDVTVENTVEETRRGTVVAEVDVTGGDTLFKRTEVEVGAGKTETVEFLFSNVVPPGRKQATYSVDASLEDVHDPEATANLTRRTAESERLGVTVTVAYPPDHDGRTPELSETEYDNVYCDATLRSAVTPFVNFHLPSSARSAEVRFTYDEADVPGEESDLALMQFERQKQRFFALDDSAVDPDANAVTGSLRHQGIVDAVVFHRPTWQDAIEGNEDEAITTICRS